MNFSELWDDVKIAAAAALDVSNPANQVTAAVGYFTTGGTVASNFPTPLTAYEAEVQNAERAGREYDPGRVYATAYGGGDGYTGGGAALAEAAKETAGTVGDKAGDAFSLLTSKGFLIAVGIAAAAVLAGPYVAAWVKR